MANQVKRASVRAGTRKVKGSRGAHTRLAARGAGRSARREWNRRGLKPARFARLRSAFSIIERRDDGHHVVAFDPTEREAEGGRRLQRRSPRGRDAPRQTRGRRVVREGEDDLDEIVRTSRKRAMRTDAMSEGDVDKIQIEVGAVKALQGKHGVYRGAAWMVGLSLLMWWIPILGPAVAGYIGGRKAGGPLRGAIAALIPISFAFGSVAVLASSTAAVPAAIRHAVEAGYTGVLGSLPFDFPILGYVLSNLAAIMSSGPDALFTVLAFALVGGAVTQMKIQERMVPPITARLPASRAAPALVQAPARAVGRRQQAEVDELVARLNDVLGKAEKERRALAKSRGGGAPVPGFSRSRGPLGWLRGAPEMRYADDAPEDHVLDEASRQVIANFLATTPPSRADRRAKAVREPTVALDLPQTIAFSGGPNGAGAEGRTVAHHYRPSKLYHVYGASVNPVAREKLEKRLRRTHTMHLMRGHARAYGEMVDEAPEGAHASPARDAEKPRSLEASALTADMHYDALEHLENARFDAPKRRAAAAHADPDDLGGVIAHIGEGGEAFVEERAVEEVDFDKGPVFDKHGRHRARIAALPAEASKAVDAARIGPKTRAQAPAMVRDAVEAVEAETGRKVVLQEHSGKSKVAASADRSDMTPAQKEKVERWLKRTLAAQNLADQKSKAKEHASPKLEEKAPEQVPDVAKPALEAPVKVEAAPRKAASRHAAAPEPAPAFEITHGSTEVDAEAASAESESASPKKPKTASEILREIRLQKKAEKEAEAGEELARAARRAKSEADAIEVRVTDKARDAPIEMLALHAEVKTPEESRTPPAKRKHRAPGLEEVETDAEKLSADLELTLSPIREEGVHISEVGGDGGANAGAEAWPVEAGIPMVGAAAPSVSLAEAVAQASAHARLEADAAPRDVKPGDVVLAGPSTDAPIGAGSEGDLSAADEDRVRRRLQEGWNRL